jgi:hypothetical protein
MYTAVLIGWGPQPPPPPPHLGSYLRALLVSQDRRHLFVTPGDTHQQFEKLEIQADHKARNHLVCMTYLFYWWFLSRRPKARGVAKQGGPPGWLDESDPAVWFCMWWTGRTACLFPYCTGCSDRSCPATSWWNFPLLLYSKCTQPSFKS